MRADLKRLARPSKPGAPDPARREPRRLSAASEESKNSISGMSPRTARQVLATRRIVPWAIAGVLALALATASWALWRVLRPVEQPLVRLDVDLGPEVSLRPLSFGDISYMSSVIISPDGTRLAVMRTFSASWGDDGNVIADGLTGSGLVLIPSSGGAPTRVTELASGELAHAYPQILPGGKAVLFTAYRSPGADVDNAGIDVVTLADRRRKTLVRGGANVHYVGTSNGTGHLVYSNKGTLFAIPFDLSRLETLGAAVPVQDGVAYGTFGAVTEDFVGASTDFDVSRSGTLIYRKATSGADRFTTIQWLDADGKTEPLLAKPGAYRAPCLSPDGKRLAVEISQGSSRDIWVYDQQRDAMTRLTFGGFYNSPIWSPDGRYVVFGSPGRGIVWVRADGAAQPQGLMRSKNFQTAWSFSPDGKRLAYFETDSAGAPLSTDLDSTDRGQSRSVKGRKA
jgi:WD40 repeat protein